MSISFKYELTGVGWSRCTLTVHDKKVTVTASYLSDALCSIVSAVSRIISGMPDATAVFDEEPGEYRWRLFRVDRETVRILIFEYDDLWTGKPDDEGEPIFDVQCRLWTFAGAVYCGCQELIEMHGQDGYKEKWHQHGFPDAEYAELKRLLDDKQS